MSRPLKQFNDTILCLADRWSGVRPLLPGFTLLAGGSAVSPDQIARETGHSIEEIKSALEDARCTFDGDGLIVDLFGMMLAPSPHRLQIDGTAVFSCCALWAHVIPKLIDRVVLVESIDPFTNELVRLEITPERVTSIEPQTSVATLAVADAEAINRDVGSAFCRHVRHCASMESARGFAGLFSTRRIVEIGELQEAASDLYTAIWKQMGQGADL